MIQGILLAAGASTRFGSPKLLHPWQEGLTLGQVSARNLIAGAGNALAVVRAGDTELASRLRDMGVKCWRRRARRTAWARALPRPSISRDARGWIVALADMPRILPSTIASVVERLRAGALIAAPALPGREAHGHPVGFSARLATELVALRGDAGARSIVEAHRGELALVAAEDTGIHADIDLPQDAAGRA